MKLILITLSAALLSLSFVGCASNSITPTPAQAEIKKGNSIGGLTILNTTQGDLKNVRLEVLSTGINLSTSQILAGGQYRFEFPPKPDNRLEAFLSWSQDGRNYRKPLHETHKRIGDGSIPYKVIIAIGQAGRLSMRLREPEVSTSSGPTE